MGPDNPIPHTEAYAYALDAFPMLLALLLLCVFHPGRFLVGPESEFPHISRKEKKAMKQEKNAQEIASKEERKARRQRRKLREPEYDTLDRSRRSSVGWESENYERGYVMDIRQNP